MEEVETEVDQAARHRRSVHDDVFLGQVPAARPHDDRGEVLAERIGLALGRGEVDGAVEGVAQVELTHDDVGSRGGGRVLHVGQPDLGAAVEGVDGHLAVGRSGDLDATVDQAGRR